MADTDALYRGACMCGGITFTLSAPPAEVGNCFCPDCQLNAGGPCQTYAVVPTASMALSDPHALETVFLITKTASGHAKAKHFCARCGCTLWTLLGGPGRGSAIRVVRVSLIEGGLRTFTPTIELFTKHRLGHIPPVPGAKQVDGAS